MHIAVIFETIGGYHAARLDAARAACDEREWRFTAIEITNAEGEHPWGSVASHYHFLKEIVLPIDQKTRSLTSAERRRAASELPPLLDRLGPHAVAIPGWGFGYSRAALNWCKHHGATAIVMSDSKHDDARRAWWKETVKSWRYVRRFDAAVVAGRPHRHYLEALGLPAHRIFGSYDVVDNDYFGSGAAAARADPQAARGRQPRIPKRPFFLAVTRLMPRKNVLRLIEAYHAYRAIVGVEAWDLVVCGSGSDHVAIVTLIDKLQLTQSVHLPGFIRYADIPDWYGLASAFIHPALQDQWGLVVNEAMAAGLPVLVSNRCGCYADLIDHGSTGMGFDPESVGQMSEGLLNISRDPVLAARLGTAAAKRIANFSPAHFAQSLVSAVLTGTAGTEK